jgi:UDP-glucose 4-epimerase
MMFSNQTLLVTGGTGSFGHNFIRLALNEHNPARVIVYSRDEKKQHDMRLEFDDERLHFVIGDVRDAREIHRAMRGVDYVFHAAALKQVPSCEFFPMEAVRTNIQGTDNVLEAAERQGVKKLVVLSTDKAVYPVNAMGLSKAMMEKLMIARSKACDASTTFCGVRYGNVMYSRGSVIPLFVQQIKSGQPITVTDPLMTRLLLPLAEAVKLVTFAMEHGGQGDIFVRKATAATVEDLGKAVCNLFDVPYESKVIGVREGEKTHEVLVSPAEFLRAEEFEEYYRLAFSGPLDYDAYFSEGHENVYATDGYTSENAQRLSVRQIEQLLLQLPEMQSELSTWTGNRFLRRRAA